VRFVQADLFAWKPDRRYDVAFFGFWLSHVPCDRHRQPDFGSLLLGRGKQVAPTLNAWSESADPHPRSLDRSRIHA
jgi:hypothetical protein